MTSIALENEQLRLELEPAIGGSVLAFQASLERGWEPIFRPSERPLSRSSNASSFPLAPYSNRLRDGVFRFDGTRHPLRNAAKHAIHGDVRDRPWRVLRQSRDELQLELRSADFADFNFPFPIVCTARYALRGPSLVMALRVENAGKERMPAGCGFHPYLQRALAEGETPQVALRARGIYPGSTPIPTGPMVPIPAALDFSQGRPLGEDLDNCFGGWDGHATVTWPRRGVALRVEASQRFGHVVLFAPPGRPYFALEPVSNANDGFNLLAAGAPDTGVVVLDPGDALEAEARFTVEGASPETCPAKSGRE